MAYCIMRTAKIKSRVSLTLAVQHNTRERQPPNADPERKDKNWLSGGTTQDVMKKYEDLLPEKVRKNAVHAIELVMTFSSDWQATDKEKREYLNAADAWAQETFGGGKNVLLRAHHRDELTPHTHVLMMPLKDGHLNCKFFLGGPRTRLEALQSDFYEKVGKKYGLERGQPRRATEARHEPHSLKKAVEALAEKEKEYDQALKKGLKGWDLPEVKKAFFGTEKATDYRERIRPEVMAKIQSVQTWAQKVASDYEERVDEAVKRLSFFEEEAEREKKRANQAEKAAKEYKKLTPQELRELADQREKREKEKRQNRTEHGR